MLFEKELVSSIYEYAPNCLLILLQHGEFLIVENWQVTNHVSESEPGNDIKDWQEVLPNFDQIDFPFIVTSGYRLYNMINIKNGRMIPLIEGSATCSFGQQPAFFIEREKEKMFEMHFTTVNLNTNNKYEQNWHVMYFREDFIKTLKEHKRMPFTSIRESLEKVNELEKQVNNLKTELRKAGVSEREIQLIENDLE